ncbi:hypothetical protein HK101_002103, partial [Irineochytrium annulatum]
PSPPACAFAAAGRASAEWIGEGEAPEPILAEEPSCESPEEFEEATSSETVLYAGPVRDVEFIPPSVEKALVDEKMDLGDVVTELEAPVERKWVRRVSGGREMMPDCSRLSGDSGMLSSGSEVDVRSEYNGVDDDTRSYAGPFSLRQKGASKKMKGRTPSVKSSRSGVTLSKRRIKDFIGHIVAHM